MRRNWWSLLAQVMAKLGVKRGMVVFGQDRLDEISMSAPTAVCEIRTAGSSLTRSPGTVWLQALHEG